MFTLYRSNKISRTYYIPILTVGISRHVTACYIGIFYSGPPGLYPSRTEDIQTIVKIIEYYFYYGRVNFFMKYFFYTYNLSSSIISSYYWNIFGIAVNYLCVEKRYSKRLYCKNNFFMISILSTSHH